MLDPVALASLDEHGRLEVEPPNLTHEREPVGSRHRFAFGVWLAVPYHCARLPEVAGAVQRADRQICATRCETPAALGVDGRSAQDHGHDRQTDVDHRSDDRNEHCDSRPASRDGAAMEVPRRSLVRIAGPEQVEPRRFERRRHVDLASDPLVGVLAFPLVELSLSLLADVVSAPVHS